MAEIGFYHLTRSSADHALPQLLGRVLAEDGRALVLCASAERVAALDATLWLSQDPEWLPHATATTAHPELQPILLAESAVPANNPNGASFLFLLDGATPGDLARFARIFDLFDGNDPDATAAARTRYAAARSAGHALAYWQQTERGWQRKTSPQQHTPVHA